MKYQNKNKEGGGKGGSGMYLVDLILELRFEQCLLLACASIS